MKKSTPTLKTLLDDNKGLQEFNTLAHFSSLFYSHSVLTHLLGSLFTICYNTVLFTVFYITFPGNLGPVQTATDSCQSAKVF